MSATPYSENVRNSVLFIKMYKIPTSSCRRLFRSFMSEGRWELSYTTPTLNFLKTKGKREECKPFKIHHIV